MIKIEKSAVGLAEGIIQKIKREKIKTKDDLGTILGLRHAGRIRRCCDSAFLGSA
jgi:hypothetical protein